MYWLPLAIIWNHLLTFQRNCFLVCWYKVPSSSLWTLRISPYSLRRPKRAERIGKWWRGEEEETVEKRGGDLEEGGGKLRRAFLPSPPSRERPWGDVWQATRERYESRAWDEIHLAWRNRFASCITRKSRALVKNKTRGTALPSLSSAKDGERRPERIRASVIFSIPLWPVSCANEMLLRAGKWDHEGWSSSHSNHHISWLLSNCHQLH